MSVAYGKGKKGLATKLHSTLIRSLKECEACDYQCPCIDEWNHTRGCKLQAAHIQGRTASLTRTALFNAFSLCASCHRKFTDKPLDFSRFVTTTWAQEYRDDLILMSNTMTKMDWDYRYEVLKRYKKLIEEGKSLQEVRQTDFEITVL